mgnify:CR=1 FL=1
MPYQLIEESTSLSSLDGSRISCPLKVRIPDGYLFVKSMNLFQDFASVDAVRSRWIDSDERFRAICNLIPRYAQTTVVGSGKHRKVSHKIVTVPVAISVRIIPYGYTVRVNDVVFNSSEFGRRLCILDNDPVDLTRQVIRRYYALFSERQPTLLPERALLYRKLVMKD